MQTFDPLDSRCSERSGGADRIPGLDLFEDWITRGEHDRLLAALDRRVWNREQALRTQQYGFRYRCSGNELERVEDVPRMPLPVASLAERVAAEGKFPCAVEQVIVNEYWPGQGIDPHVDHGIFGPVAAILSLGDAYPMLFDREGADPVEVILPVGSLAVLSGECRWAWRHSIPARNADPTPGGFRNRLRRVSVTFRPG